MSQNTTKYSYLLRVIYLSLRHVSALVLGHLQVINVHSTYMRKLYSMRHKIY